MNKRERDRIHEILNEMNLPSGRWVLAGSGSMVLHGIDRVPRDLDVFCATQTWFSLLAQRSSMREEARDRPGQLWDVFCTDPDDSMRRCDPPYLYRVICGLEVNVFSAWRRRGVGDLDVAFWIHNAEVVDGVPCVPLRFLLDWKREVGRAKDVGDIELIESALGSR